MFKTDFKIILLVIVKVSNEGCFLNGDEISWAEAINSMRAELTVSTEEMVDAQLDES